MAYAEQQEEMMDIYRVIENNKTVPFVQKIKNKVFRSKLVVSQHQDIFIVYPGSLSKALKENNYVDFPTKEDADWFVANYQDFYKEKPPDEMNQRQFESWRSGNQASKWKFAGTVEKVG